MIMPLAGGLTTKMPDGSPSSGTTGTGSPVRAVASAALVGDPKPSDDGKVTGTVVLVSTVAAVVGGAPGTLSVGAVVVAGAGARSIRVLPMPNQCATA